ncbi:hypothetical protein GCM10027294_43560 [Marinactinospora endophytica]
MTDMAPIVKIEDLADRYDDYFLEEARRQARARAAVTIPTRYRNATADHEPVREWARSLVAGAIKHRKRVAFTIAPGKSLTLLGPTGTGKTHQAYGVINGLVESGLSFRWEVAAAADIYAQLRPRHGIDSEAEFSRFARADLLVIDDLGAAKTSEWVEEVNYRLINYRYERECPTLITSNVPVKELVPQLGERVASRLREMSDRVVLAGPDRRGRAA